MSASVETSIDHYLRVRDFFVKRDFPALLSYPFAQNFPLIQVLRSLACFYEQKPQVSPDLSAKELSLGFQCQLALLWALLSKETGEERYQKAANELAGTIVPLVKERLLAFGTREEEFYPEETEASVDLLLDALGETLQKENREGFFFDLQKSQLRLSPVEPLSKPYHFFQGDNAAMAYSLQGSQISLGSAHIGTFHILSFGLQGEPCTDLRFFGADVHSNGYVSSSAFKKVWVRCEPAMTGSQEFSLSIQAIGMQSEIPLYFVFYVRAASCQIKNHVYKPKNLRKFHGETESVRFGREGFFETEYPNFIELVPLAGEGPFWGASFLLAYRFPLSGKIKLRIAK